ncbi:hypothetical protein Tco_1313376 [Tanacetum coccineum]
MGWVVCSDAVMESCDVVLMFMVTASRYNCDVVYSHCREILDQCWCRTSTRNKSSNTSNGLATIQAQLNNLGREIKKVNERVYLAQVGCELCSGPHYIKDCPLKEEGKTLEEAYYTQFGVPFPNAGRYRAAPLGLYQRDNVNPSYKERRKMMEESLSKFMAESAKRHYENSSLIKEIRASTDDAIRNQGASIKALDIQNGKMSKVLQDKKDDKMQLIKLSQANVPFPGHLKEYGYDEKEVLNGLKKLQVNSEKSAESLRRLLKETTRIEEEIKA